MSDRRLRTLEQRAAEDDVVFIAANRQVVEELEGEEDGPVFVSVELDLEGHPLVRNLILRRA